jgi:dTMP kinase
MKGKFIVLDGCDFTGKSTQIQKIATYLRSKNIKHITTREPGGTQFGEQLREIILETGKNLHPQTELMLFFAARNEHIHTKITPMLNQGISIICDRFLASSFVYQGMLRGIPTKTILTLHKALMKGIKPDITFILDITPETILERMEAVMFHGCNSYDSKTLHDIAKIRNGFLEFATKERCEIIDASKRHDEVSSSILQKLEIMFENYE